MKKVLFLVTLTLLVSVVFANDFMTPGPQKHDRYIPGQAKLVTSSRADSCLYNFSITPISLLTSYYDYMIGGYNDLPMCVEPDPLYGGYFLTFHGKRTATGQRRVFFSYISDNGVVQNNNELTNVQNWEGFASIAIDPLSGKPLYAWHAKLHTEELFDVQFAYDAFLEGAAGLISDPVVIVDNSSEDKYNWPSIQIGPSPNAGMRRVYVLCRNAASHVGATTYASENVWIMYADFNASMLELGEELSWNHTTIPYLDTWNHADDNTYRRPFYGFTVGNDGRIYYVGYHASSFIAPEGDIVESDLDAFVCDNYGAGTWTRVMSSSDIPGWNPKTNFGTGNGWILQADEITPVPDDSVYFSIVNSSHINTVLDSSGKIHTAALWAPCWREGTIPTELSAYYLTDMQITKELIYDTNTQNFSVREIYPMAGTPSDTLIWMPWDTNSDGEEDEFYEDDITSTSYGYPLSERTWPFPFWDRTVHTNLMFFHYNGIKITKPNAQGMMAAVWQESNRARLYNTYPTDYAELAPYADTPEIYIACSPDNGYTWSKPIVLNKIETTQLAGMRPMWVYPSDQVKYTYTTDDNRKVGKLALLFYDDFSWGSYVMDGPVGQNDGGSIKFTELNITFPQALVANDDQVETPVITMLKQNYPNPFNPETTISFIMPKSATANLSIYNPKGQLVNTLIKGVVSKGEQKIKWQGIDKYGNHVASGLYFYKLETGGRVEARKMILMK